ncbi:hypothetical protein Ais01nite_25770 [Asanoa ishikariensis]|uniref:FtsX-like permease family protein n=1 Tax=Asanoa ishikariensis TaxID=137265 RepID=A0A1H3QZL9_9ACTN|nr:hypothetical protein [Asanoa ishikariensis]GIF64542.1 hypothetical protein Ais01nite_25770 [Asanoa ishikariensis]SDZ18994.1 hypothetical protein SAMN05421684_3343 [Asanoa ishikariensis]
MIGVIVDLLRAARRRTGVLVLLGALPVAAAVAGPAYVDAAQRAIVASEVAAAKPNETVLNFAPTLQGPELGDVFENLGASEFSTPGFDLYFSTAFDVAPRTPNLAWKLAYRDDVCAHVTFDAGRCPTGRGEVMIGFHSAAQLDAGVGDAISFRQSRFDSVDGAPQVVRLAKAVPLSIVGVYRPTDPTEAYWGPVPPFPPGLFTDPTVVTKATFSQVGVEPMFGSRATSKLYGRPLEVPESQAYDLVADPDRLSVDWVDAYPAELDRMKATAFGIQANFVVGTDPLLARIEQSRSAVRSLVPWLAMTVVPLCWFVIFLAAASGAEGRRSELGQVAVRGLPLPHRWWLAAGPDAIAVLVGAPLGWVAGQFVGGYAVPGGATDLSLGSALSRFAAVAVVGAVLAVVFAYRPVVTGRAIDLVRKVTRQVGAWRSVTVDAMVVALAAFAVIEARTAEGPVRGGLATLAPVLVILAGALLAGRLLAPAARRVGRRALSAGRLAGALSGIELSRRSAPRRAVTLAVLGAALLCFTVLAVDAGAAARAQRAGIEVGAARVFDVNQVSGGALRAAVRAADPEGRWAMAAVIIPATGSGPPSVAADTERLATVAWPGSVPADLLSRLRPAVAPSVPVTGNRIRVDATVVMPTFDPARDKFREGSEPELWIVVQPPGESERRVALGDIALGRHQYTGNLPECGPGCRLVAVEVQPAPTALQLTVHEISQLQPDQVVAGAGVLDDPARWRATTEDRSTATAPKLTTGAGAVTVEMAPSDAAQRLVVADATEVLPILRTTSAAARETDTGWAVASPGRAVPAPATAVGARPVLPGVGASGTLVDLDYLDRAAPMGAGGAPQVWVGPDAPADAVSRLADAGLTVLAETVAADRAEYENKAGAALAARYELVTAAFAVLLVLLGLGLVAAVERADRSARGRVLRAQGVAARTLRAATRLLDLWPVLLGVLLGPLLALAAWALAGQATPVFLDAGWPMALPVLPDLVTLGLVWAGCAVLLVIALAAQQRRPKF